jgi:apolipoprotein N-acyltransferase
MPHTQKTGLEAGPEQILYASILEKGMFVGLVILFITFALYAFGIMKPYIPLDQVSQYWGMPVGEYLKHAHIGTGWSWIGMIQYGDFINFIGVAVLAGVTIICYVAIVPILLKNNDKVYAVLAILTALVLAFAASGILKVGH